MDKFTEDIGMGRYFYTEISKSICVLMDVEVSLLLIESDWRRRHISKCLITCNVLLFSHQLNRIEFMAKRSVLETQQEKANQVLEKMNAQSAPIDAALKDANAILNSIDKKDTRRICLCSSAARCRRDPLRSSSCCIVVLFLL